MARGKRKTATAARPEKPAGSAGGSKCPDEVFKEPPATWKRHGHCGSRMNGERVAECQGREATTAAPQGRPARPRRADAAPKDKYSYKSLPASVAGADADVETSQSHKHVERSLSPRRLSVKTSSSLADGTSMSGSRPFPPSPTNLVRAASSSPPKPSPWRNNGVCRSRVRSLIRSNNDTSQNRKVTDYFPIRRSGRKCKSDIQTEKKKKIDEAITSGIEDGMEVQDMECKGRGVIATHPYSRGDYVVEYSGELIELTDAKLREAKYAEDPGTGCYMYYFCFQNKKYCVDATKETGRLGRLVNHSKVGNCQVRLHAVGDVPHLILVASKDINTGEELLYDYGDRSSASLAAYPWLRY
uniref:[histone H4]-lysine(20) N-methyltransferase n=1 Tax=Eptatretus burgeri TaxID=7764 RepID=A0A8C4PZN8_EPTBU